MNLKRTVPAALALCILAILDAQASPTIADLVVSDVVASATQADPDQQIALSCNVRNVGGQPAGGSRLKYYFSADATLDGTDRYLNYDNVVALDADELSVETANVRVPAGTPHGGYFVLLVADYDDDVVEEREDNNVFALPITVGTMVPQPDLTLSAVQVPTPLVSAGDTIAVSAVVDNIGDDTAPDATLKYYLSTDPIHDDGDKQLSYDKIDSLAAGASGPEDAALRVTSATTGGNYYILFVADAGDVVAEHDEGNNVVAVPIVVTQDDPTGDLPDLVASGSALGAQVVAAGDTIAVSTIIENVGVAAAAASRLRYYLSVDSLLDDGDTYLNYDAVGTLAARAGSAEEANLTIPAGLPNGAYHVLLSVDSVAEVTERYESNNLVALPFTVGTPGDVEPGDDPGAAKPDLQVSQAWLANPQVMAGTRAALSCEVTNAGNHDALQESKLKYYLSRDDQYGPGDTYVGYDNLPALGLGELSAESVTPMIPADCAGGAWHLLMVVDATDVVSETYESNNVTALPIEVLVDDPSLDAADLTAVSPWSSKAVVGAGRQLTIDFEVDNQGSQAASPSRLKIYLSADDLLDPGDAYLDYRQLDSMAQGETVALEIRLRIPAATTDGAYHLLVVVDVNRDVVESYESNNLLAIPIIVGLDEGPDAPYPYDCPSSVFVDPSLLGQHTVATFNALHLGWDNSKDMTALACVVSHFDLVGLVEIADPRGLTDLELALESLTGEDWASHVSEHAVGNENGTEFYGYIWRSATVTMTDALGFYDDVDDDLKREPYGASFQLGSFDFTLVVFHEQYGDTVAIRRAEAAHLIDVYNYFQSLNGAEQDLLIGGDFNLSGDDAAFTLVGFDGVTTITDPEQRTSIGPEGLVSSFDNIFYPAGDVVELVASGAYDFTNDNYDLLSYSVSDHIPVWMAFDTSIDDD